MSSQDRVNKFDITGLDDLFHPDTKDKEFPLGSTLVLAGSPGAGKTTFALSLARSIIRNKDNDPEKKIGEVKTYADPSPKDIIYYISTEVTRDRLKKMFEGRGWFSEDPLFKPSPDPTRTTGLHVINPPLDIERPVKASEELVNYIVRKIASQPPPEEGQLVYVIVDSITALFKDSDRSGEARRQIFELIHRIKGQFPKTESGEGKKTGQLGMIMLLSEQGSEDMQEPGIETYVADFVFRLAQKSLSMGVRIRTLDIVKSQGGNLVVGTHTWLIVTSESVERLIKSKTLRDKIRKKVNEVEGKDFKGDTIDKWGSILIAPRPYPQMLAKSGEQKEKDPVTSYSGITGLDQMLRFMPEFWFNNEIPKQNTGESIKSGSVTILVGEAGTGKTSLCHHFIASHILKRTNASAGDPERNPCAMLVSFEHDLTASYLEFIKKYLEPTGTVDPNDPRVTSAKDQCEIIHRNRSGLHFNLFLLELRTWLTKNENSNKRVAIDGISNLAATHTRQEFSQMLDALLALFANYPQEALEPNSKATKATLLLTYEAAQNASMLDADAFRLPANNIVLLQHKVIDDDRRTAVTVLKSSYSNFDTMVRELVLNHEAPRETWIRSGFDAYSGLINGPIQPARVVLQLFDENDNEEAFNRDLREYLNKLLPYEITHRGFSRFHISSTHAGKSDHVTMPGGDVQIVSIDEWWISHKVQEYQKGAKPYGEKTLEQKYHLANLASFVAGTKGASKNAALSMGDFWCFEIEKACVEDQNSHQVGLYALPSSIDFGMLCVNRAIITKDERTALNPCYSAKSWNAVDTVPWLGKVDDESRKDFILQLETHLTPWCTEDSDWFKKPDSSKMIGEHRTLVDQMLSYKNEHKLPHGFAWDNRTPETSASFFYELAWAFGAQQDFFGNEKQLNKGAVAKAIKFVGFLVLEGLAPACPTLTDTAHSAYSRHYYSTYTDVNCRYDKDRRSSKAYTSDQFPSGQFQCLYPLGFMPPGSASETSTQEREYDANERMKRISERCYKLLQYGDPFKELYPIENWKNDRAILNGFPHSLKSPNPYDIDELIEWKIFRDKLQSKSNWEDVIGSKISTNDETSKPKLRTGHGCCGAWMMGVKSPTGAPGLAQVVLQEMNSLTIVKKRARMGAGLPARQDFYQHYGNRPVVGMEHLSYSELLKFLGSRARRRDRIYGTDGNVDPAKMHKHIQHGLTQIMLLADQLRIKGAIDAKDKLIKASIAMCEQFYDEVNLLRDKATNNKQ